MAFFVLNSEITIGDFSFKAVHDVRIKRGIHSYTDMAIIRIPSKARIMRAGRQEAETVTTATLFTDGDPVTIKLGYNGELRTEFEGFVRRRNLGMPLEVECEGYSRLLRLKSFESLNLSAGMPVKDLLKKICAGTGITVECTVDFSVYGVELVNSNGIAVLDEIIKCSDGTLAIFFKEPKVLWCGLIYTSYLAGTKVFNLPTVNFRLGYNVIKDNSLRERIIDDPVQVIINGQLATGDSVRTQSDNKVAKRKVQFLLNGVHDISMLKKFATEKGNQHNYAGYEGHINAFLQPFCLPGYDAFISDERYKERDGKYLVESTEVIFGMQGARRRIGIGPKLG